PFHLAEDQTGAVDIGTSDNKNILISTQNTSRILVTGGGTVAIGNYVQSLAGLEVQNYVGSTGVMVGGNTASGVSLLVGNPAIGFNLYGTASTINYQTSNPGGLLSYEVATGNL